MKKDAQGYALNLRLSMRRFSRSGTKYKRTVTLCPTMKAPCKHKYGWRYVKMLEKLINGEWMVIQFGREDYHYN